MTYINKFAAALSILALSACGTLTGIPSHGGGKRFTEEQRLVSSSIRLAVKQIDFKALRGKRVAIIFGLIADEGGGNIVGGRASITSILTQSQVNVPMSSTNNSVDIFQVATTSNSATTGTSTGTSNNTGTTVTDGTNTATGTSSGTSSQTASGTSNTTSNSTTNSSTTGTSTAATTSEFSTDANQTTTTTSTSTTPGTSTGTNVGTTTSTTTGTNAGSNTTTTNIDSTATTNNSGTNSSATTQTSTNNGTTGQAIVTGSQTSNSGRNREIGVGVKYEGLGQYQNLTVPKSDAAYLMSQVRNSLLLNHVTVTIPEDPSLDAVVYVSVDVLGTNRQRTDLLVYNKEKLRAEAHIEIFALDRRGRVLMAPQIGNVETHYEENYIAWTGPFETDRGANLGTGLIEINQ